MTPLDTITAITFAIAGVSILMIVGLVWLLWRSGLKFPRQSLSRFFIILYSVAVTAFGGFTIWLIVGWVEQLLDPKNAAGSPGPFAWILILIATGVACGPSIVGVVVMRLFLTRAKRVSN